MTIEDPDERNPWKVECPRCGGAVDRTCMMPSGTPVQWHHVERWRAVGVPFPTDADRERLHQIQHEAAVRRFEETMARLREVMAARRAVSSSADRAAPSSTRPADAG